MLRKPRGLQLKINALDKDYKIWQNFLNEYLKNELQYIASDIRIIGWIASELKKYNAIVNLASGIILFNSEEEMLFF